MPKMSAVMPTVKRTNGLRKETKTFGRYQERWLPTAHSHLHIGSHKVYPFRKNLADPAIIGALQHLLPGAIASLADIDRPLTGTRVE
jgi:hypothetical protein